jgi:hypothetical protein
MLDLEHMQEYVEVMFGEALGGEAAGRGMRIMLSTNTCK